MQEHDIGSDPNWRVQHGKGIYIEITIYIYIYQCLYSFITFNNYITSGDPHFNRTPQKNTVVTPRESPDRGTGGSDMVTWLTCLGYLFGTRKMVMLSRESSKKMGIVQIDHFEPSIHV